MIQQRPKDILKKLKTDIIYYLISPKDAFKRVLLVHHSSSIKIKQASWNMKSSMNLLTTFIGRISIKNLFSQSSENSLTTLIAGKMESLIFMNGLRYSER